MGLDVTLYYSNNWDKVAKNDSLESDWFENLSWEKISPSWWATYKDKYLEDPYNEYNPFSFEENRKLLLPMLMKFYQENNIPYKILPDEEDYKYRLPETRRLEFKIGDDYDNTLNWWSSYNGFGIDSVLRKNNLPDVYNIHGLNKEEVLDSYTLYLSIDWQESLNRLNSVMSDFSKIKLSGDYIDREEQYNSMLNRIKNVLEYPLFDRGHLDNYKLCWSA